MPVGAGLAFSPAPARGETGPRCCLVAYGCRVGVLVEGILSEPEWKGSLGDVVSQTGEGLAGRRVLRGASKVTPRLFRYDFRR